LYNIPIEFGIPMKQAGLIKMCLNEAYRRVRVANICLACFLLWMVSNKEMFYHYFFATLLYSMPSGGFRYTRFAWN